MLIYVCTQYNIQQTISIRIYNLMSFVRYAYLSNKPVTIKRQSIYILHKKLPMAICSLSFLLLPAPDNY